MGQSAVERATIWNRNNKERRAEIMKRHAIAKEPERQSLLSEAYEALGGKCAHCGYNSDPQGFELDHVNDDGVADRAAHGSLTNLPNLRKWKARDWSWFTEIQLLCASCNRVKSSWFKRKYQNRDPYSYASRVRDRVLIEYSETGKIECSCGETRVDALEIAHLDGDGNRHRQELRAQGYSSAGMANLLNSVRHRTGSWPRTHRLSVMCATCHRIYDRRNRTETVRAV